MPPIKYYDLGPDKQLNEIVFAGSHDAGITGGKDNVQTQSLDIKGQAAAGVRFFDLRIAAHATDHVLNGVKVVQLQAFHADGLVKKDETKVRNVMGVRGGMTPVSVERTKPKAGGWGEGLVKILKDARAFVESTDGQSEFLLLKFDKCLNWQLIAEACVERLGSAIYTGADNLNTKTLRDLQGKVVVLFSSKGKSELHGSLTSSDGILQWKNLKDEPGYSTNFPGLQYYGKGGTNAFAVWRTRSGKTKENVRTQSKLLRDAKTLPPQPAGLPAVPMQKSLQKEQVLGMMYWTTTGLTDSIEARNNSMWAPRAGFGLAKMWAGGLGEYVDQSIPYVLPAGSPAAGPLFKRFMPNIVMIDFADDAKCRTIYELNNVPESVIHDFQLAAKAEAFKKQWS